MGELYAALRPWIAIGVSVSILAGLQLRRATPPEMLFLFGLMIVTLTGIVPPDKALAGFANQGVLTIAGLLVALPPPLVITTVYVPPWALVTEETEYELEVAPRRRIPSRYH